MADEKMVEVELLAGQMQGADGVNHVRGDVVSVPESRVEELEKLGAIGKKGTIEKADEEAADLEAREARNQRALTGIEPVEVPAKRGPGRPRKTESSGE